MTHEQTGSDPLGRPPATELLGTHEQQTAVINDFARVYAAWSRLVERPLTEDLFGDEETSQSSTKTGKIGRRSKEPLANEGGTVSVTIYEEGYREIADQELRRESIVKPTAKPIGHISGHKTKEGAEVFATLFLLEDEKVLARVERNIRDGGLSEDSMGCYGFASSLGLGDAWVNAMRQAELENGKHQSTVSIFLGNAAMVELAESLQKLADTPRAS